VFLPNIYEIKEGKVGETSSTHDMRNSYKTLTEETARKWKFRKWREGHPDPVSDGTSRIFGCEVHAVGDEQSIFIKYEVLHDDWRLTASL